MRNADIAPSFPFIALDIETVRLVPPGPGEDPSWFPPPPVHRIVCLGRCWVGMMDGKPLIKITSRWSEDEAALTREAINTASDRATLVTFNGRRFDLPVLVASCMRNRLPWPWFYYAHGVRTRYSANSHVDIADELSEHGAASACSLDKWGQGLRIGRKSESGQMVEALWEAGERDRIATYCANDVRLTAALYLRWLLVRGEIGDEREAEVSAALASAKEVVGRL